MFLVVSEGREHDPGPGHPERPERIAACIDALEGGGKTFRVLEPARVRRKDLLRVHEPQYLDLLRRFSDSGGGWLTPDTPAGPVSMKEAELAAGACCRAGDLVVEENETAICLVRPPGHHAERGAGMGFCLLNNAAVATRHLQSAGAGRVAIVDIDVHHGNGTQEVFWEDGSVLYVSIHQWPWYPWATGSLYEAGTGDGEWKNVNVPLPAGSGDDVYLAAMTRVVDPVVSAFDPELIVVSAGFDAHERDPLSLMEVTSPGFGVMGAVLAEMAGRLCAGRMLVVLEGGYDPVGTSTSLAAFVDALWWGGERVLSSSSFPPVESAAAFHLPRLELA